MEGEKEKQVEAFRRLMAPFDPSQISKLPKGNKKQNECPPEEKKNCAVCGGWHHPKIKHLDYVGHAALTKRLLEVDPFWNWEPFAVNDIGEPKLDEFGGMWIKLTICGVTRLGYGDAGGKRGADANKERIGDALRNGSMRFGAAIDLWIKTPPGGGNSQQDDDDNGRNRYQKSGKPPVNKTEAQPNNKPTDRTMLDKALAWLKSFESPGITVDQMTAAWEQQKAAIDSLPAGHLAELKAAKSKLELLLINREGEEKLKGEKV